MKQSGIRLYTIVVIGLMAAMVFVSTMFLSIRIPTPTGTTMIKTANIICVLAGLLFGGWKGGTAAGLGSMIFDFLTPEYIAESPLTFIRFFIMAFVAGIIAYSRGKKGTDMKLNLLGAVAGCTASTVFYIGKSIVTMMLAGSAFMPALLGSSTKIIASLINMVIAIVVSVLLAPVLHKALTAAGVYRKLESGGGRSAKKG